MGLRTCESPIMPGIRACDQLGVTHGHYRPAGHSVEHRPGSGLLAEPQPPTVPVTQGTKYPRRAALPPLSP